MNTSDDRDQQAEEAAQKKRLLTSDAQSMHESGRSNAWISYALGIPENEVRKLVINWGYNCLTSGPHHGRPEAIWNIPLLYATQIFSRIELALLVLTRIHKDALQITLHNEEYTTEWANRVRAHAEEMYDRTMQHKVGELSKYYDSPGFKSDIEQAVKLVTEDKLNPGYAPLHSHDTINMLCRIIGSSASRTASQEQGDG